MSMTTKTALITGVSGQDGYYLAQLLLGKGYRVVGTSQRAAQEVRLPALVAPVELLQLDLTNSEAIDTLIKKLSPDEVYNFAARSSSAQLFDDPIATAQVNGLATVRFLEAIRTHSPLTRFCQAASSEVFAGTSTSPQDEGTALFPINAYGAAKAYAANMVAAYRAKHGLFAVSAILFNHESPRRGHDYVSRKITHTVAQIVLGQTQELRLGNLDSRRDWGFAGDYVHAMWLMLQQPTAQDFVIATGVTHSVRELCDIAFAHVGLNYRDFVRLDAQQTRRADTVELCGNPQKARQILNWQPSLSFADLVQMMVDADLTELKTLINLTKAE